MRESRLAEQFEDLAKQGHAARLGMWVFLGSEILLFAGLFALYAAYRTMYPAEFAAAAAHNNAVIGTVNTLILITSSFTVAMSVHAVREARPKRAFWLLVVSVAFGAAFLGLKAVEYRQHFHEGILPGAAYRFAFLPTYGAHMFFTLYYLTTGLHALHVTAGMCLLSWVAWGAYRERYGPDDYTHVDLGGLYWHLVDVIWIFLWPLLYLLRAE